MDYSKMVMIPIDKYKKLIGEGVESEEQSTQVFDVPTKKGIVFEKVTDVSLGVDDEGRVKINNKSIPNSNYQKVKEYIENGKSVGLRAPNGTRQALREMKKEGKDKKKELIRKEKEMHIRRKKRQQVRKFLQDLNPNTLKKMLR